MTEREDYQALIETLESERRERSFWSRWSQRKRDQVHQEDDAAPLEPVSAEPQAPAQGQSDAEGAEDAAADMAAAADDTALQPVEAVETEADPIDARTGKRYSELTDDDMPPLTTLGADSDLSMFMARNVSAALRMKALTRVFHTSKFNQFCLCAEYADDYTNLTPMGSIVPHDLKQAIVRETGRLYDRLVDKGYEVSTEEVEQHIAASMRGEPVQDLEQVLPRASTATRQEPEPTDDAPGQSVAVESPAEAHVPRPASRSETI